MTWLILWSSPLIRCFLNINIFRCSIFWNSVSLKTSIHIECCTWGHYTSSRIQTSKTLLCVTEAGIWRACSLTSSANSTNQILILINQTFLWRIFQLNQNFFKMSFFCKIKRCNTLFKKFSINLVQTNNLLCASWFQKWFINRLRHRIRKQVKTLLIELRLVAKYNAKLL